MLTKAIMNVTFDKNEYNETNCFENKIKLPVIM